MKKEVIIAIAVGFGLGLVITFGIWTAQKSLKKINSPVLLPTPSPVSQAVSPSPTTTAIANSSLTITSPEDESLVNTGTINIVGKATPKAVVAVTFEDGQNIVTADDSGNFSLGVDLIGGYNTIVITALDPATGTESSQTLLVTYSTAKL